MPSFTRRQSTLATLLCGLLAGLDACTSTRGGAVVPPIVVPDTTRTPDRPVEPVAVVFPRPRWDPVTYQLTTETISQEPASGLRDSTRSVRRLQFQPQQPGGNRIFSMRVRVIDTVLTPPVVSLDSGRVYQLSLDGLFTGIAAVGSCTTGGSVISPLYARLLIPRYALDWPQRDSLTYDTCMQGVRSQISGLITWQSPVLDANRTMWLQQIRFTGQLLADSTRSLPLHLRGTFNGTASVTYSVDAADLLQLNSRITFIIDATSSARQQHLQQVTVLQAVRH